MGEFLTSTEVPILLITLGELGFFGLGLTCGFGAGLCRDLPREEEQYIQMYNEICITSVHRTFL